MNPNAIFSRILMVWLLWSVAIFQASSQAEVQLSFAENKAETGDVVRAFLRISVSTNESQAWLTGDALITGVNKMPGRDTIDLDTFADIEIIDPGAFKDLINGGKTQFSDLNFVEKRGVRILEDSIEFIFYSAGIFECSGPSIGGLKQEMAPKTLAAIEVSLPEVLLQKDSLSLQPIKDIMTEPAGFVDYLPWIICALAVIFLVWAIWYFTKKRSATVTFASISVKEMTPPHEKALKALQQLKTTKYWVQVGDKEYQSAFTAVVRDYLSERYRLPAKEMTSAEIIHSLDLKGLRKELLSLLEELLQLADRVKFAKASASEDTYLSFIDRAVKFVNATKQSASQ